MGMYELELLEEFCAAHALTVGGVREPVHGHNWRVALTIGGETLDGDGLLCDFHTVRAVLSGVCRSLDLCDLNEHEAFAGGVNPSAERVARHIAEAVIEGLGEELSAVARVSRVRVTESPGCSATYVVPSGGAARGGGA